MLFLLSFFFQPGQSTLVCLFDDCCEASNKFKPTCTRFLDPRAAAFLQADFCETETHLENLSLLMCQWGSAIRICENYYYPPNFDEAGFQNFEISEDFEDFSSARENVCDLIPPLFSNPADFATWKLQRDVEDRHAWIKYHSFVLVANNSGSWEMDPFSCVSFLVPIILSDDHTDSRLD